MESAYKGPTDRCLTLFLEMCHSLLKSSCREVFIARTSVRVLLTNFGRQRTLLAGDAPRRGDGACRVRSVMHCAPVGMQFGPAKLPREGGWGRTGSIFSLISARLGASPLLPGLTRGEEVFGEGIPGSASGPIPSPRGCQTVRPSPFLLRVGTKLGQPMMMQYIMAISYCMLCDVSREHCHSQRSSVTREATSAVPVPPQSATHTLERA